MKRKNMTRNALFTSIISLLLCVSMLVGTTFAWFTDTVTSGMNTIAAGNLDVVMEFRDKDNNWKNVEDYKETEIFVAPVDGEKGLWEPGHTEVAYLKITNNGSLNLKYNISVSPYEETIGTSVTGEKIQLSEILKFSAKSFDNEPAAYTRAEARAIASDSMVQLNEYLDSKVVLAPSQSKYVSIAVYMPEETGNEANYTGATQPKITFGVTVLATQVDVEKESDSFGDDYDAGSWNVVYDETGLRSALEGGEQNIQLGDDIELSDSLVVPAGMTGYAMRRAAFNGVTLNLNGYTLTLAADNTKPVIINEGRLLLKGGEIEHTGPAVQNAGYLEVTQMTVTKGALVENETEAATVVVTNGTYVQENLKDFVPDEYETTVGENGEVTIFFPQASLDALIKAANSGKTVEVPAGTYTFPASAIGAGVTLECAEGTVFEGTSKLNINGSTVIGATFSNPNGTVADQTINGTFVDCTFTGTNAIRWAYAGETVVFENCVFDGSTYGVHFDGGANGVYFKNCTISGFNAMGGALTNAKFEGCTFKANGKSAYNGINMWGDTEMIDCTFVFDGQVEYEWIDLCSANKTATFTNCVVTDGDNRIDVAEVATKREDSGIIIVDGITYLADGVAKDDNTYYISNRAGYAWMDAQADNFFGNKTIKLTADIDFGGETITGIKFWNSHPTFDGDGHTLSNFVIGHSGAKTPSGLFQGTFNVKNLNVDNANVTGDYAGGISGNIYGNIDNCTVKNSTITSTYWQAGGIVAQFNNGNVTNCTVENSTISGGAAVGGLVGILNETAGERKIEGSTVQGCAIEQNTSFGGNYDAMFGVAVGLINIENSQVFINNCTISGNTVKSVASEAWYGVVEDGTTVTFN